MYYLVYVPKASNNSNPTSSSKDEDNKESKNDKSESPTEESPEDSGSNFSEESSNESSSDSSSDSSEESCDDSTINSRKKRSKNSNKPSKKFRAIPDLEFLFTKPVSDTAEEADRIKAERITDLQYKIAILKTEVRSLRLSKTVEKGKPKPKVRLRDLGYKIAYLEAEVRSLKSQTTEKLSKEKALKKKNKQNMKDKLASLNAEVKTLNESRDNLSRSLLYVCAKVNNLNSKLEETENKSEKDLQSKEEKVKSEIFQKFEEDLICSICTEFFIKPTVLDCSHTFCEYCIMEWRSKKNECPNCRCEIVNATQEIALEQLLEKTLATLSPEQQDRRLALILQREDEGAPPALKCQVCLSRHDHHRNPKKDKHYPVVYRRPPTIPAQPRISTSNGPSTSGSNQSHASTSMQTPSSISNNRGNVISEVNTVSDDDVGVESSDESEDEGVESSEQSNEDVRVGNSDQSSDEDVGVESSVHNNNDVGVESSVHNNNDVEDESSDPEDFLYSDEEDINIESFEHTGRDNVEVRVYRRDGEMLGASFRFMSDIGLPHRINLYLGNAVESP